MARARELLFRIFYSSSYTFTLIVLLAFIAASPIDTLYQSWRRRRRLDLALVAGTYVVTGLIALLIYASRLYTNRSVINAIPKTYMPTDRDELPSRRVWRYVADVTLRSAVIAYQSKPRSKRLELELAEAEVRIAAALKPDYKKDPDVDSIQPKWGPIEHRGWSSPAAQSQPNLEYRIVVEALTDLLEATAVSLAHTDLQPVVADNDVPIGNEALGQALERLDGVGMREYVFQLVKLGMIPDVSVATSFLKQYEQARFSPQPLTQHAFQALTDAFNELLLSMRAIDPGQLDSQEFSSYGDEDKDSDPFGGKNSPKKSYHYQQPESVSRSTLSATGSVVRGGGPPARVSEDSVPSQTTDESELEDLHETRHDYYEIAASPDSIIEQVQNDHDQTGDNTINQPMPASIPALASTSNRPSRTATRHSSRTNISTGTSRRITSTQRPVLRQQRSQASSILSSRSGLSARSNRSANSTGSVIVRLNPEFLTRLNSNERTAGDRMDILPYDIVMPSTSQSEDSMR